MVVRVRRPGLALTMLAAMALLGGCASIDTNSKEIEPPVGVGTGINELKRSPCACLEIPMAIPADMVG